MKDLRIESGSTAAAVLRVYPQGAVESAGVYSQ